MEADAAGDDSVSGGIKKITFGFVSDAEQGPGIVGEPAFVGLELVCGAVIEFELFLVPEDHGRLGRNHRQEIPDHLLNRMASNNFSGTCEGACEAKVGEWRDAGLGFERGRKIEFGEIDFE